MSWKEKVDMLIINEEIEIDHLQRIVKMLINPNNLSKEMREYYNDFMYNKVRKSLLPVLTDITKQYSTFLFPSIITRNRAPNFWFYGEEEVPNYDEAWKAVYLLLTAVPLGNTLFNIDNVNEEGRNAWRREILSEDPKEFYKRVKSLFRLTSRGWDSLFISLLVISYFVYKTKTLINKSKLEHLFDIFESVLDKYGFRDDTTLIVFKLGRTKKEIYYFSKIIPLIKKWYREYIEEKEDMPTIISYMDSLTTISSNNINNELITSLREKLTYYLLKYNTINGEILQRLTVIKCNDVLNSSSRRKRVYGIKSANRFFDMLR